MIAETLHLSTDPSTFKNALSNEYRYDLLGRRTDAWEATNVAPIERHSIAWYDAAGDERTSVSGLSVAGNAQYQRAGATNRTRDSLGRILTELRGLGGEAAKTSFAYDAAGNLTSRTTGQGTGTLETGAAYAHASVTDYGYDSLNRLTTTTEAAGTDERRSTSVLYDGEGRVLSQTSGITAHPATDPRDHRATTAFAYDALGRAVWTTEAAGTPEQRQTYAEYDSADNLTATVAGITTDLARLRLQLTAFEYDLLGRQTAVVEAAGVQGVERRAERVYDSAGNLLSETTGIAPPGQQAREKRVTTTHAYDGLGRLEYTTEAAGTGDARVTRVMYDAAGNAAHVASGTAGNGTRTDYAYAKALRVTTDFDAFGRPVRETRYGDGPGILTTTREYDAADNLILLREESSAPADASQIPDLESVRQTAFVFDSLNRQTQVVRGVLLTKYPDAEKVALGHGPAIDRVLYDAAGNVDSSFDARGVRTDFYYDALNRKVKELRAADVSTVEAGAGFQRPYSKTSYDSADNAFQVEEGTWDGGPPTAYTPLRVTKAEHDRLGRRTRLTEAAGSPEARGSEFQYDAADNLVRQEIGQAVGQSASLSTAAGTTFTYDAAANQVTTYAYDALNLRIGVTEAVGVSNPTGEIGHDRPVTALAYDSQGNLVSSTSPVNTVTAFEYDFLGRKTKETVGAGADARASETKYDAQGNAVWERANGVLTMRTFDAVNRRTGEASGYPDPAQPEPGTSGPPPAGPYALTVFQYSVFGVVVRNSGQNLDTTYYAFDRLGRQREERTGPNLLKPDGTSTGRPGHAVGADFDAAGNRIAAIDDVVPTWKNGGESNTTQHRVTRTTYAYDPLGRVVSQQDPDPGLPARGFGYDGLGRMNLVVGRAKAGQPRPVRLYEYDLLNRMTAEKWFDDAVTATPQETHHFAYDALDHLLMSSTGAPDAAGSFTRHRAYDALGRLESSAATGVPTLTYAYDAASRRTRAEDSAGNFTTYAYDAAGRLTGESFGRPGGDTRSIGFAYQAAAGGGKSDRAETVDFKRGGPAAAADMRLQASFDAAGRSLDRHYTWTGLPAGSNTALRLSATYKPKEWGGLAGTSYRVGQVEGTGAYYQNESYYYDKSGQISYQTRQLAFGAAAETTTYAYDPSGGTPYDDQAKALDPTGGYRSESANGFTMEYDGEGNVVTLLGPAPKAEGEAQPPHPYTFLTMKYDHANRLISAEGGWTNVSKASQLPGSGTVSEFRIEYAYDAEGTLVGRKETWHRAGTFVDDFGQRIARSPGEGSEVRYMHDGRHVWADVWTDGTVIDRYVHGTGTDELLAKVRLAGGDDREMYYLTDRQGSVQVMVLADGGHRFKDIRYLGTQARPWGDAGLQPFALHDRFGYTGREFDPVTGLQYNRARWLHPGSGRFVTEDSLPDTVTGDANPYRYVKNSYANATDPSGHVISWATALIGAGVGAALGAAGELVTSAITGEEVTWGKVAGAAASGAISGAIVGAAAGAITGDVTGLLALGALGAAGGSLGGKYGNALTQKIDAGKIDWEQADQAGAMGAIGGAVGGFLGAGVGKAVTKVAGRLGSKASEALACGASRSQVAGQALSQSVAGGATGMAADAAMQIMDPSGQAFSWRRAVAAGVNGAIGGGGGYAQNRARHKACFRAGTPLLLAGGGSKAVEEFLGFDRHGEGCDRVISRDEGDPDAPALPRRVLQTFERLAEVLELGFVGGVVVGTTAEHPFWLEGEGWVPASRLTAGSRVRGLGEGEWAEVLSARPTGAWEMVYNLEVEGGHTYFVGQEGWGFALWAHNYGEADDRVASRNRRRELGQSRDDEARHQVAEYNDRLKLRDLPEELRSQQSLASGHVKARERAEWLKDQLTPEQQKRTTYGVAEVAVDQHGTREIWVSEAGRTGQVPQDVRAGLRGHRELNPDGLNVREVHVEHPNAQAGSWPVAAAPGRKALPQIKSNHLNDAERHIMRQAEANNSVILAIDATRPMCAVCQRQVRISGVEHAAGGPMVAGGVLAAHRGRTGG